MNFSDEKKFRIYKYTEWFVEMFKDFKEFHLFGNFDWLFLVQSFENCFRAKTTTKGSQKRKNTSQSNVFEIIFKSFWALAASAKQTFADDAVMADDLDLLMKPNNGIRRNER